MGERKMTYEEMMRLVDRYSREDTPTLMEFWEKMYRGDLKDKIKEDPYETIFMLVNSELDRRGIIKVM